MKLQINDTNYAQYKMIFEIIGSHITKSYLAGMPKDIDPVNVLNNWEAENKAMAKRGLKAGLQDLISQVKEFPPELKIAIDKDLAANQLPSLSQLQGIHTRIIAKVLKKQKIMSLDEFYIVKEEVTDLGSDLTGDERMLLDKFLSEFESSKRDI